MSIPESGRDHAPESRRSTAWPLVVVVVIGFAASCAGYWIAPTILVAPGNAMAVLGWWMTLSNLVVAAGGFMAGLLGPSRSRLGGGLLGAVGGVILGPVPAFLIVSGDASSPVFGTPPSLPYADSGPFFLLLCIAACVAFSIGFAVGGGIALLIRRP